MASFLDPCNETGSPSMSRTEDNLSNSDGPLLKRNHEENNIAVRKMVEENQKKLQVEIDLYKQIQKEYHKALVKRQELDDQLNGNTAVKEKLDLLSPGWEIFKLIGTDLVKQDLIEAKQDRAKRIEYISNELKRTEDLMTDLLKKLETHQETLDKLQQVFQQVQQKASKKSKTMTAHEFE